MGNPTSYSSGSAAIRWSADHQQFATNTQVVYADHSKIMLESKLRLPKQAAGIVSPCKNNCLLCLLLCLCSRNLIVVQLCISGSWKPFFFFFCHRESIISLKRKYLKSDMEDTLSISHANMDATLDIIAKEGCSSLLDEVFMDLEVRTFFLRKPQVLFRKKK